MRRSVVLKRLLTCWLRRRTPSFPLATSSNLLEMSLVRISERKARRQEGRQADMHRHEKMNMRRHVMRVIGVAAHRTPPEELSERRPGGARLVMREGPSEKKV